ncbi:TnsA endonuclease N-terminal domain-containing protein [Spiribacter halobius]|nr:TnsA endonuclease N-terminal domain-containing protein [Spiribacter halobius]UEX77737.1 TnsA endonuclease N-terminal domain-containing protein [Spiribacter halobius]
MRDWPKQKQKILRLDLEGPVRRIGRSRRSVTGQAHVRGRSVRFESSLECDFLNIVDFDPTVTEVIEQPLRIHFQGTDGRLRHYTPDFLVRYLDAPAGLFEIKYRENLWAQWKDRKPAFKAARQYAKKNGMTFSILTEVEIRGSGYLGNAKFLRGYIHRPEDRAMEEKLVSTLVVLGESTPAALLAACFYDKTNRMKAIPSLWRLVAINRVNADLTQPLTMNTPIWIQAGEGFVWNDPHSYQFDLDQSLF